MTVQCQSASNGETTTTTNALLWLLELHAKLLKRLQIWADEGRMSRSRRTLESLPEHILHDIGWPNVDDRLPGIHRNPTEFQHRN